MTLPDGSAVAFAVATRVAPLSADGSVAVGASCYVTDALVKYTFAPNMETGDDLVQKNAAGNLYSHYKHGDMVKYYVATVQMATPDPVFEQLLVGGTLLNASGAALAAIGTVTATSAITGGSLAAGAYAYRVSAYNQYGEGIASAEVTATVASGIAGSVSLSWAAVTGAVGYRIYGRTAGAEQLIGSQLVPGATTAFVDTGSITPNGAVPTVDHTAGPGNATGYAAPTLGTVGNENGVSFECWQLAISKGAKAVTLPYMRWVFPAIRNLRHDTRDITDAWIVSQFVGEAFENPNWGNGPFSDWPFPSSQVWQREREGAAIVPTPGFSSIPALA